MVSGGRDAALRLRVEEALRKTGVSGEQSSRIAGFLLSNEIFHSAASRSLEQADTSSLNFAEKIHGVVERFAANGLTVEKYLAAAQKQPSLFCRSPETIERHIRGLVERFAADGLTVEKYLAAAGRQPSLFGQSPETIERNIRTLVERFAADGLTVKKYVAAAQKQPSLFGLSSETIERNIRTLVERFAPDGLTVEKYLAAAVKQPPLFYQSPETIERNIRTLVGRFAPDGLTVEKYLAAAVKQPPLFCQSPETIERNIRTLVERFAPDGLTVEKYLAAAVKQPQLFCRSPETITAHINQVADIYRRGQMLFGRNEGVGKLTPVLNFLCKNPVILCLGADNLGLRDYASGLEQVSPAAKTLFGTSRRRTERAVAQQLGHRDLKEPIPPIEYRSDGSPESGSASRWVLRAMIHAALIKSGRLKDNGPGKG
jgi:hypothetical protein